MRRYCSLARSSGSSRFSCNQICMYDRESNIWLFFGGFQEKGPDNKHLYNSHVLVDDTGNIKSLYRKIHLYINFKKWMSFCLLRFDVHVPGNMVYKESNFTTPGHDIVVVDSPVGRLGLTVCYDLRFPELSRLLQLQHDAQVLLVPAAFTRHTGKFFYMLGQLRLNVVAAAQAGKHNEKRESYGDSLIIDSWGRITARLPDSLSTGIAIADIDLSNIACED